MTGGKMIGLTVCIILTLFTGNKLRKMLAIRGWFPGARVEMKVITGKEETSGRPTPAYWIAWDHENPKAMGNHRVNLDFEPWSALSIRDEIEVRYIGKDLPLICVRESMPLQGISSSILSCFWWRSGVPSIVLYLRCKGDLRGLAFRHGRSASP